MQIASALVWSGNICSIVRKNIDCWISPLYSDNVICVDIEEGQEFGAQDMFENDDKKELVPSG